MITTTEIGYDCRSAQYSSADKREFGHHVYVSTRHKLVITTIPKVCGALPTCLTDVPRGSSSPGQVACTGFMKLIRRMNGSADYSAVSHAQASSPGKHGIPPLMCLCRRLGAGRRRGMGVGVANCCTTDSLGRIPTSLSTTPAVHYCHCKCLHPALVQSVETFTGFHPLR